MRSGGFAEDGPGVGRAALPGEGGGAKASASDEVVAVGGIVEESVEGEGPRFRVVEGKDDCGIGDDLGEGAAVGADDGASEAHGLEGRKAEALVEGGKDEGGGAAVEGGELVVADVVEVSDAVADGGVAEGGQDGFVAPAGGSAEEELAVEGVQEFEEAEEEKVVLAGFEGADVKEEGALDAEGAQQVLGGGGSGFGETRRGAEAGGMDAVGRLRKRLAEFLRHGFAHGEEVVRACNRGGQASAEIREVFGFEGVGVVEEAEVVDDDGGAGAWGEGWQNEVGEEVEVGAGCQPGDGRGAEAFPSLLHQSAGDPAAGVLVEEPVGEGGSPAAEIEVEGGEFVAAALTGEFGNEAVRVAADPRALGDRGLDVETDLHAASLAFRGQNLNTIKHDKRVGSRTTRVEIRR